MSPSRRSLARRQMLQAALALLAAGPLTGRSQDKRIPIDDMHSHYGMISRRIGDSGLAQDMRSERVALLAWKLVADGAWIRATSSGIEQSGEPAPGELARLFAARLQEMKQYVAAHKLRTVLTRPDVDACIEGEPGIVLASEGADFLEGKLDGLEAAFAEGLRHVQLVHYIRTPVGDLQTVRPVHDGLTSFGKRLVEACNAKGILVDLAHCTPPGVDHALEVATAPLVWSHGWVDWESGRWQDRYGFLARRLSLPQAKKIAARGGVIGVWALGLSRPGLGWSVGTGDVRAYAKEIAALVNKIGADHVAFGTDIEGLGPNWAVNNYGHVRRAVEHLQELGLESSVVERLAYGNYARVLKAVLKA